MDVGSQLLQTPFAETVQKLAISIAEAQLKLDTNSTEVAEFMAKTKINLPEIGGSGQKEFPLIALGFYPTFYAVQTAEVEVKMAISMTKSRSASASLSVKGGWGPVSAQVDASYSSKFNYSQTGSSRLYFKMAPTPPPSLLQAYVEALVEMEKAEVEAELAKAEPDPAPSPTPTPAGG